MSKKIILFVGILTLFSLVIRIYRFDEPKKYYFDEVYHAVTAKAYADNNPDPYDPFSHAPQGGTAYDWLHPPLAKLIQAGSIKIFGDNSFGWRLPSVIFGTGSILATFLLTRKLYNDKVAIFASIAIAFENLTFVMSRITMNDIFVTFFIIFSFLFAFSYSKENKFRDLVLCAIFLGLAVATKWTGIYAILVIFIFLFLKQVKDKKFNINLFLVLIVPAIFYLAAYGQFFLQGHTIRQFVDLHKQIWWYQNRRDLEHTYGTTALFCAPEGLDSVKTWCPWILDVKGVYFSYQEYGNKQSLGSSSSNDSTAGLKAGYIYAIGNPAIFWIGIIAVSYLFGKFLEERRTEQALVLIGYFIFWVPWIFAPRILFLYHYLPSIPFLSISLGVALSDIYDSKFKYLAILVLLIFIGVFFYLYPISSGWPIKPESISKYMLLKTWR